MASNPTNIDEGFSEAEDCIYTILDHIEVIFYSIFIALINLYPTSSILLKMIQNQYQTITYRKKELKVQFL